LRSHHFANGLDLSFFQSMMTVMAMNGPEDPMRQGPAPTPPATETQNTAANPASGFRARLEGLSLFDLVQMECLARSRRIVRVASSGRVGYLYFRDGGIVHAGTRNLVGERAALEILAWNDGVFEPCHIAWPERTTISAPWQRLLLSAAKAKDEHAAGKLVHLPSRRNQTEKEAPDSEPQGEAKPSSVAPEASVKAPESLSPSSVQQAVRIDPNGQVLSIVGDDREFGGFAAYATRLADLIGQSLGLDRFIAIDLGLESSRCVIYIEDKGNVVAVKARNEVDLGSVARRAGV
jgi:hypothetical protein